MESRRTTTVVEKEVMEFLNDLRITGVTNMFGAGPYVKEEYPELSQKEIREIQSLWMNNFNEEGDYEYVKTT